MTNTRQAKRAPVTLKIKFKSENIGQFIERYAVDISHGGIFIRTKKPLDVGTQLRFEFQLRDAKPLISGEGTVVWAREPTQEQNSVAPGMGVRFDKLSQKSQDVLDQVLAQKSVKAPAAQEFAEQPTRVASAELLGDLATASNNTLKPPGAGQSPRAKAAFENAPTLASGGELFQSDAGEFSPEAFEQPTRVTSLDSEAVAAALAGASPRETILGTGAISNKAEAPQKTQVKSENASAKTDNPKERSSVSTPPPVPTKTTSLATVTEEESAKPVKARTVTGDIWVPSKDIPIGEFSDDDALADDETHDFVRPAALDPASSNPSSSVEVDQAQLSPTPPRTTSPVAKIALPAPDDDEGERTGSNNMSWIAVAGIILLLAGVGGFWLLRRDSPATATKTEESHNSTSHKAGAAKQPSKASQGLEASNTAAPVNPVDPTKPQPAKTVPTRDVTISTVPPGATLTVNEETKTSPGTFQVPEKEAFTVTANLDGYVPATIDVKSDATTATITLKERTKRLQIDSTPQGAVVILDGRRLAGRTPINMRLSKRHLEKTELTLQLRLPGHITFDGTVALDSGFELSDEVLVQKVTHAFSEDEPATNEVPKNPPRVAKRVRNNQKSPSASDEKQEPPSETIRDEAPPNQPPEKQGANEKTNDKPASEKESQEEDSKIIVPDWME